MNTPRSLWSRCCAFLAWALVASFSTTYAQGASTDSTAAPAKYALVIGNGTYTNTSRSLKNAVNDAKLMGKTLQTLGFDVKQYNDLGRTDLMRVVSEFSDRLPVGATSLVYYAGHGMQLGGASYLIPVDMAVTSEQSIKIRAYSLKGMLDRLSTSKAAVNVVVLDACRDNPFQPSGSVQYRSFRDLGLAPVQAPRGTLVAYSTAPGQLAADGPDNRSAGNSVYTEALARVMLEPHLSLEQIFKKVGEQVRKKTLDDQIPWFESSLAQEYFFMPPDGISVVAGKSLQGPGSTPSDRLASRRNVTIASNKDTVWYRSMGDAEWSEVDWTIQQRVQGMTKDELPAMEHKANGGNVIAQTTLGVFWRNGIDKAAGRGGSTGMRYNANNTKALYWLRKAVQAGFPVAQVELGEMYYGANGVDRDLAQAKALIQSAASANYPRAKIDLMQLGLLDGKLDPKELKDVMDSIARSFRLDQPKPAP